MSGRTLTPVFLLCALVMSVPLWPREASEADLFPPSPGGAVQAAAPSPPPPPVLVRGRVLGLDGTPLAAVRVGFEGVRSGVPAQSDAAGEFALEAPPELSSHAALLRVLGPDLVTVCASVVERGRVDASHVLVAAPRVDLEGTVTDPLGAPLSGARVRVLVEPLLAAYPGPLDQARVEVVSVRTDDEGRFALRGVPAVAGARVVAVLANHEPGETAVPAAGGGEPGQVLLVLRPSFPAGPLPGAANSISQDG
ncbi:MAG: carboxypeptidase-like regulatory domain-containing protein [Planctomycetota bacterium]